jgi:hypothetical protein
MGLIYFYFYSGYEISTISYQQTNYLMVCTLVKDLGQRFLGPLAYWACLIGPTISRTLGLLGLSYWANDF